MVGQGQYYFRDRDKQKSQPSSAIPDNNSKAEEDHQNLHLHGKDPTKQLVEIPVINMEDFRKVDVNDKLDLLMAAINKINTNFHYKFQVLTEQLTDEEDGVFPRLRDLESNYDEMANRVEALETINASLLDEVEVLKGLLHVQDTKIKSNTRKVVDLMPRSMANNVVIKGIVEDSATNGSDGSDEAEEKAVESCKVKALKFFWETMEMEVQDEEVIVAHRIGNKFGTDKNKNTSRQMVVRCQQSLRDRIFKYAKNLKDK